MDDFSKVTGQSVSLSKSQVLFSKVANRATRTQILQLLRMVEMSNQKSYIGNPIVFPHQYSSSYNFFLDRVQTRLQGWRQRILSHAGREVLIKATISSIPMYFMSTAKLHQSLLKKITAIMQKFWWGFDSDSKHLYTKRWDSFQFPKIYEGLRFRNLNIMNWAL